MPKQEKEQTFEENLENLETIVKNLENGNIPLEEAIKSFNEAMLLAKKCDEKLKKAEEQVNSILNKDGELVEFNFEE